MPHDTTAKRSRIYPHTQGSRYRPGLVAEWHSGCRGLRGKMAYDQQGGGFQSGGGFQRKMYQGNWQCSQCNEAITELPFEPSPDKMDRLLCKNCYREKRSTFSNRR